MRFDTLADWLAWQETLHPTEMDLGLERVRRVWTELRGGESGWAPSFPVVTVAGTNGKGSTVAFVQSLLAAGGARTGTYTSPHLVRYNERIRIDGRPVADGPILAAFDRIDRARGDVTLTYFEFGTLAAMEVFREAAVDAAVFEVGIGGRLDAVNLFDADVAVVTPIDIDHVHWLGPDRESIGREKAGIFRPGRPAVVADRDPPASILAAAGRLGAPCFLLGRDFDAVAGADAGAGGGDAAEWTWRGPRGAGFLERLPAPALAGRFQRDNAAAALMALDALGRPPAPGAVRRGIAAARLAGRFQRLPGEVPVILDVAHNPHAARSLAATLRASRPAGREIAVAGLLGDKDVGGVVEAMAGIFDRWFVARPAAGARGGSAETLFRTVRERGGGAAVEACANVPSALLRARGAAGRGDRIVVFGSCYTVGEVLAANPGLPV